MATASSSKTLVIRFFLMVLYVCTLLCDFKWLADCPNPTIYYGVASFGGRFKFLTHLTLWANSIYFTVAFLVELLRFKSLQVYTDWFFTTVCCGMSFATVVFFWGLYFLDRENIYPSFMDGYLPVDGFINHSWHTLPLIAFVMECVSLPHYHPSPLVVVVTLTVFSLSYISWILIVYHMTGIWVYPFMEKFNTVAFILFCSACSVICGLFYILAKQFGRAFGQIRSLKQKSN